MYSIIHYYDESKNLLLTENLTVNTSDIKILCTNTNNKIQNFILQNSYFHANVLPISKNGYFYFLVYNCFVPEINQISFVNLNIQTNNNNISQLEQYKIKIKDLLNKQGLNIKLKNKLFGQIESILGETCLYIDIIGLNVNLESNVEKNIDIELYLNSIIAESYNINYKVNSNILFINNSILNWLANKKKINHNLILYLCNLLYTNFEFINNIFVTHGFDNAKSLNNVIINIIPEYKFLLKIISKPVWYFIDFNYNKNSCLSYSNSYKTFFKLINKYCNFSLAYEYIRKTNHMCVSNVFLSNEYLNYINFQIKNIPFYYIDYFVLVNAKIVNNSKNFINSLCLSLTKAFCIKKNVILNSGIGCMLMANIVNNFNNIDKKLFSLHSLFQHKEFFNNFIFDININLIKTLIHKNEFKLGFNYGNYIKNIIPTKYLLPISLYTKYKYNYFKFQFSLTKFLEEIKFDKNTVVSNFLLFFKFKIYGLYFLYCYSNSRLRQIENTSFNNLLCNQYISIFFDNTNILNKLINVSYFKKFSLGFLYTQNNSFFPYINIVIKDFI